VCNEQQIGRKQAARAWQEAQVEEHVASALHNAAQQQQALVADKERVRFNMASVIPTPLNASLWHWALEFQAAPDIFIRVCAHLNLRILDVRIAAGVGPGTASFRAGARAHEGAGPGQEAAGNGGD
jgi:hypothetical protein